MSESKQSAARRGASRRAFLKTIAAGSAAALTAPAFALAADAKQPVAEKARGRAGAVTTRPPEIEKGLEEQKGYLRQTLEAIRGHELPVNSEQAFTFAPLEAARGGGER